jgi:hypothetical protein
VGWRGEVGGCIRLGNRLAGIFSRLDIRLSSAKHNKSNNDKNLMKFLLYKIQEEVEECQEQEVCKPVTNLVCNTVMKKVIFTSTVCLNV